MKCIYILYYTFLPCLKYHCNLTIKPEVSRTLFDRYLLGCLWADGHQTWQGGWGCTLLGNFMTWTCHRWLEMLHFCQHMQVRVSWEPHWQWASLTTKPEVSRTLYDRYLLGRLQTDGHQTWQEGLEWARKGPCGTCFHGNQCVAMVTWKNWFLGEFLDWLSPIWVPGFGMRVKNPRQQLIWKHVAIK